MLRDSQIDRYSRHVILPEIGGGGQERLLASSVAIHGDGDAALLCASYLAGAGIGALWLGERTLHGPAATVVAASASARDLVELRNPDCRLLTEPPAAPTAAVAIGGRLPEPLPDTLLFWGGVAGARTVCARAPSGACRPCLASLIRDGAAGEAPASLGAVLALLVLRSLIGLDRGDEPWIWRLDGDHPDAAIAPFPHRPGCSCTRGRPTP